MLGDTVTRYNREINRWFSGFYRKKGLFLGLFQVITVLQAAAAYAFVGARTAAGAAGIGDFTMYVSSAIAFSGAVIALGTSVVTVSTMLGFLEPFAELMRTPDAAEAAGKPVQSVGSVEFRHEKMQRQIDAVVLFNAVGRRFIGPDGEASGGQGRGQHRQAQRRGEQRGGKPR